MCPPRGVLTVLCNKRRTPRLVCQRGINGFVIVSTSDYVDILIIN